MRNNRLFVLAFAGAAFLAARPAQAQREVVLHFHKAGDTLSIRGAAITVDHIIEAGETDAKGNVTIPDLEDGGHILEAVVHGYESIFDNFKTGPDATRIEFELRAVPPPPKPKGQPTELHFAGFESRRAKAMGTFFTAGQLDKARGRPMTNLLKVDAHAAIVAGPGAESYAALDTLSNASCYTAIVRDGLRVYPYPGAKPTDLDRIFAEQFVGVEFYPRPAMVPAELKDAATCGALVLWSADANK